MATNPDPVPVPRSVAERALSDAKMRLRIEKDRAGSGSIISAQYVETYEHDIAALESALAAPPKPLSDVCSIRRDILRQIRKDEAYLDATFAPEDGPSILAEIDRALSAPADDEGWCYELDQAPLETPIEVSATTPIGNQISRAIFHDDGDGWFYLLDGGGPRLFPYAWRPLPAPAKPKERVS